MRTGQRPPEGKHAPTPDPVKPAAAGPVGHMHVSPHAPSYLHNIDYQKFGRNQVDGIMKQKYKPDRVESEG